MPDAIAPPITSETVSITAPGAVLTGTLTQVENPTLVVSINGATGVPAAFYQPFAQWLAVQKNAAVLTWDYRDFGKSGQPYRSKATMTDWAITDPTATRTWLETRFPGLPLWVIGHSLGAMALGFQPDTDRISRIISVAAGHGHITDHPLRARWQSWFFWYLVGPLATTVLGYLPGSRIGLGSDLPKGVYWQWRHWLLTRDSLPADPALGGLNDPGYAGPITILAADDDTMMPPASSWKMAQWHPHAQIECRLLKPADFGLKSIGHIHAFAPRNSAVWPSLIAD